MKSSADGFIYGFQAGLMVAGDDQSKLRHKIEEILPHKTRSHDITPSQILDARFIPTLSFIDFIRDHESSTGELCNVARVLISAVGLDERFSIGDGGVLPKKVFDRGEIGSLAIST